MGERAWAGVAWKQYPKIISFFSGVHFFLGMIQVFVLFSFFPLWIFFLNDTSHRIHSQPQRFGTNLHCPLPRWPGAGEGAGSSLEGSTRSRRNTHTPVDISGGGEGGESWCYWGAAGRSLLGPA